MRCPICQGELEYADGDKHARCKPCGGLFSNQGGQLTPLVAKAPGGGQDSEFQAIFEEQLGFPPRAAQAIPPQNQMGKIIRYSTWGFVATVFIGVAVYIASFFL